jgi:hypothetical protein
LPILAQNSNRTLTFWCLKPVIDAWDAMGLRTQPRRPGGGKQAGVQGIKFGFFDDLL